MPNLSSLMVQPSGSSPPQEQGSSGSDASGALTGLLNQGQAQPPQGGQMKPPSHHETVAMLDHMNYFAQRWGEMLKNPEVGEKNMRGSVYELMADAMSDGYASLPQVMGLLKTLPTDPLEQKQWIEQHYANDMKASLAVLNHHAATRPPPGALQDEMASMGKPDGERADLVNGAVGRYKKFPKKPSKVKGIPLRG